MRPFLVLILLYSGWLSSIVRAQTAVENAVTLAKQRRYAEARQALSAVTEPAEVSQRIAFHRLKAAIASGLGESNLASREMNDALAMAPRDSNLLLSTAIAEMQSGLLDHALQHAQAAGHGAVARAVQGDIEDQMGDYAAAAAAYQAAVSLAPDREQYRVALAIELIQHQSFPAAIELLTQSQVLFPKSAKLRTLIGIAQYASGFSDEAIKAFEDATVVDPHFEPAYSCLARVLLESSSRPAAKAVDLLCAWNAVTCSAAHLRVAREEGDAPAIRRAIKVLEQAPPQNVTARCELARAYEWSNQFAAAREQMEACVRLDPTPQNHYRLGRLYQKLDLADLARQEMEIRTRLQAKMSDQTAAGLNALQSFKPGLR